MSPTSLSSQHATAPIRNILLQKVGDTGMARFFSPTNLSLFRRLASEEIAATERTRVLDVLAHEWDAFKLECRTARVSQ